MAETVITARQREGSHARPQSGAEYPWVFHGGEWVDWSRATVHVQSLAMRYAVSAFEGVRAYRQHGGGPPHAFRLDAHTARLAGSARVMHLPDCGLDQTDDVVRELIERNDVGGDAFIRLAVSARNPGTIGDAAESVYTVTATAMGRKRWLAAPGRGMRLLLSTWERSCDAVFPAATKSIATYGGARLAQLAAQEAGFDGCIMRNRQGRLCEAPTATLFVVRDGMLLTPALSEGILPSITRAWVLETAPRMGIRCAETELADSDALQAEEAFLCGTGIELAPIQAFDGHELPSWMRPSVTSRLITQYFRDVRSVPHEVPTNLDDLLR